MATVHLPRSLAMIVTDLPRQATVEADTVADVIAALDARWPGVADRVLEPGPKVRSHINVFVNGERGSIDTPVPADAVVYIIPAVAGG